ncbi:MAG: VOC family protein [Patescibacteria group bacterium]
MFQPIAAFSGFSVLDLAKTKTFYNDILGLKIEEDKMGLQLHLPGGATVFIYEKKNHQPAEFTILNLIIKNIDESIDGLAAKGVKFEHYNSKEMPQDEKGVLRGLSVGMGPNIAWFQDPSHNIISLLQEK